jgi:tRNA pseudouridine55 synthase
MPVENRDAVLLPVDALLADLPMVGLDDRATERILHGQGIRQEAKPGSRYRLYAVHGAFIGLGEQSGDGWLNPRRLIATAA